jgi:hypothetical protein
MDFFLCNNSSLFCHENNAIIFNYQNCLSPCAQGEHAMVKKLFAALLLALLGLQADPARAAISQATVQKLLADDNAAGDNFGYAVAVDGGTAVIGAPYDDNHGSAYVFVRSAEGSWSQQAKLVAGDSAADDNFGSAVAVDGGTAVIGAPNNDSRGTDSGSAYVFVRAADGSWSQEARLSAADGTADDYFGTSVSVDGDTAVIGAKNCNYDTGACPGSAYVFARSVHAWGQQAKLVVINSSPYAIFGRSVSVSGDIALIGSDGYDANGFPAGAAFVFVRTVGGGWVQEAKLATSDASENDSFGCSVAVDGNTALIGSNFAGSAYIFVRSSGGAWNQEAKLRPGDAFSENYFSSSVSISGDTAVIGIVHGSESDDFSAGAAYVFGRSPQGSWAQQAKLAAPVMNYFAYFGSSVSVDGGTALIGSWGDDRNGAWSGAAYVFTEAIPEERAVLPPGLQLLLLKE